MTAQQYMTMRVYIADFTKCKSRNSFYSILADAFGGRSCAHAKPAEFWRVFCERAAFVISGPTAVKARISGLEDAYAVCPDDVIKLIRVLRAVEERSPLFSADIKIGSAVWHCR